MNVLGAWLFRNRGWTPVPVLVLQGLTSERVLPWAGFIVIVLGELIRMWAVGHIGSQSRTRGGDVGKLIQSGPFGRCRNPLYVGNGVLLIGVGIWGGLAWATVWFVFAVLQYTAVVRWEESILLRSHGAAYQIYCERTPRWMPLGKPQEAGEWSLSRALRSERATLLAIAVVVTVFWGPICLA